jgi:phosphate/sulfate permease
MVSAGIISLITGTLLISASLVGLPQSLVQLNSFAIFGLGVARKKFS